MIIKSIYLKEGMFERKVEFDRSVTMIHSQNNSCGKTTLLRFVLYGMGYNIPNTKGVKFDQCEVTLNLICEKKGEIVLHRYYNSSLVLELNETEQTFVLPDQQLELHEILFGTDNENILSNLLGAFYVDQEKGWTLLNRGKIIGSIRFNIEDLIRGLSDRDCEDLKKKIAVAQREKNKYKQMHSVAVYREQLEMDVGSVAPESYEEETNAELSALYLRRRYLKKELDRIDRTLSDNKRIKKYVLDFKLVVRSPKGEEFPVKEENIVGLTDSIDLLITKRKVTAKEYAAVNSRIESLEREAASEYEQLAFFESASQIEIFDKKILRMNINAQAVDREIKRLETQIKQLQEQLRSETDTNNPVVKEISDSLIKYGTELGIGDNTSIAPNYLFTSNLKELSGAMLHKTAFAFRLAYIDAIEKRLNIKLPIILDSPSGKEIDQKNIALMMDILKRDFSDNQIIIASIYSYDFENAKVEEIQGRLISEIINLDGETE